MSQASSQSALDIINQLIKLDSKNQLLADFKNKLFSIGLDKATNKKLHDWAVRDSRSTFVRYSSFYSPEDFLNHVEKSDSCISILTEIRNEHMQLESQALTLAIQYSIDISQRKSNYELTRLHAKDSAKNTDISNEELKKIIDSIDKQERDLEKIHAIRQGLHSIEGGALNFFERLDDLKEQYLIKFKQLLDHSEAAFIGIDSTLKIDNLKAPPIESLLKNENSLIQFRLWFNELKNKVFSELNSEVKHRFHFSLVKDNILPDLLNELKNLNLNSVAEFEIKIPFPEINYLDAVGIYGVYPVIISDRKKIKTDDIKQENSYEFSVRQEDRAYELANKNRAIAFFEIKVPEQISLGLKSRWTPATRVFNNVTFVTDSSLLSEASYNTDTSYTRVTTNKLVLRVKGKVLVGNEEIPISSISNNSSESEFTIRDVSLIIEGIYRTKKIK